MRKILHHTKKYDGGLHYRFNAHIVRESDDMIVLYRGPGHQIVSYRGTMTATRHILIFFYKHHFYNVCISWHGDWTPHMHYVNIATPASWDDELVTAVDMDLDVILLAEEQKLFIDDEDEFEAHREKFGYPAELVASCRSELNRIHKAVSERKGIFSDEIFSWRPGKEIPDEIAAAL